MQGKVKVLVVDDSPLCRQLICEALERDPDMEVIGTAGNGQEAVDKVKALAPQVVTLDVEMPVMDGLSALEHIMAERPTPILMLTADPRAQAPELTCRALELGALALQVKPAPEAPTEAWNLAREVKLLSSVRVIRHLRGSRRKARSSSAFFPAPANDLGDTVAEGASSARPLGAFSASGIGLVAIASSTGGPQVVHKLLSELPAQFPAPIVLVQHIHAAFIDSLAGWLAACSKLKVRVARDGDALIPGEVFLAPPGLQTLVAARGRLSVQHGEAKDGHLPSATLLLESAAKAYGRRALGMILTGMGIDGVDGIAAIRAASGKTLAQSEDSCVVFGMPGTAISRNVVDHIVHADELAEALVRIARNEPWSTR